MAFQAFEIKRRTQLGNLTRRRRIIDDLANIEVSQQHIAFQRGELEKIRTAHDEITNAMEEQPECQEDLAERLHENIDKFYEAYDELQEKLTQYEVEVASTVHSVQSEESQVIIQRPPAIQTLTVQQCKIRFCTLEKKFNSFVNLLNSEESTSFTLEQLKSILSEVTRVIQQFDDAYDKLSIQLEEEVQQQEFEARQEAVRTNSFKITSLLYQRIQEKSILHATPSSTSTNSMSSRIKLPPIDLPKFNGSPECWIPFRDLYIAMIHDNAQLSGSQKYRYLKTSIIDKLSPVKFDTETDAGYEQAWEKVLKFYDDKRKIVDNHFTAMLNAKKMVAETSDELQRLINEINCNTEALHRLVKEEDLFDAMIAHLAAQRLDAHTRDLWESENSDEIPTWETMKTFLEKRRKTLSALPSSKNITRNAQGYENLKSKVHHASSSETNEVKCPLCYESHRLMYCAKFLDWDVNQRHQFVKEKRLCFNCLCQSHTGRKCQSKNRCRECKQLHHSLLHFENSNRNSNQSSKNLSSDVAPFKPYNLTKTTVEEASTSHTAIAMEAVNLPSKSEVLLSTIAVYIEDDDGQPHLCRALLDSGSDSNFMTTKCAQKLNVKLQETCMSLTGISEKTTILRHKTCARINSHYGPFEKNLEFAVMPQITGNLPTQSLKLGKIQIPQGYSLADPKFHESAPIDLLLSAEVFYDSLLGEKFRLTEGPVMLHTKFGWILGGEIKNTIASTSSTLLSCFSRSKISEQLHSIENKLEQIFEAEDITFTKPVWTAEEKYCEETFCATTIKDSDGKFITHMPMKENFKKLGSNYANASRQLYAQETRRKKDDVYNKLYVDAMNNFISTKHMTEVRPEDCAHYLPHHGVMKMSSTSTKMRPVFNASSKTETGVALNDVLCVGPTIQPESIDIITRFREKKFVITGDITKMYRQIKVNPSQRKFLSVLWRTSMDEPIKHYQMNVVTFGTACAPFLAIRVLQEIANEHAQHFPEASTIFKDSFYVDDLMFGVNNLDEGKKRLQEIRQMLSKAGMTLGKITANNPALLQGVPANDVEVSKESSSIKTLGILYDISTDQFSYEMKPPKEGTVTKTEVLSLYASIYDPIGWLGPVTVTAKLFMKKLWLCKLDWKDQLSENLLEEWNEFRNNLTAINDVRIPRRCVIDNHERVELHGFCDASINAYGAVIYAVSSDKTGRMQSSILCSKSRVAPKNQKTLARLELCSATLLAKLMQRYSAMMSIKIDEVVLWSDSTIVLNWITMSPNKLQTFVGNRVAVVQELTHMFTWRHIRGDINPADIISRGLKPQEIVNCTAWWKGPDFLMLPKRHWPESIISINENDPEIACEVKKTLKVTATENLFTFIETEHESAKKIQNIFAYVRRFASNCRKNTAERETGYLTLQEIQTAETDVIKIIQKTIYPIEYAALQNASDNSTAQQVSLKSSLIALTPFMDNKGIIRVRGRLEASPELNYDQKHQIILPPCNFATGIIKDLHQKNLHPTKSTMMSLIFQRFWIIKATNIVKKVQRECIKCFRVKPKTAQQLMGDLPEARVKLTKPFEKTAVDYAGYYVIKTGTTRNAPMTKSYVAVFKCMCTGAVHLEVVSDLSAQAFITVLDRFVSRRGICAEIFSDNATCFKGADNTLKKIVKKQEPQIKQFCNEKSIKWNFTTPRSPSAGGVYESGVKFVKHHLNRIMDRPFTFEQFSTILCKIEAIVNSRPLTPMSQDPSDFRVLTPGHFLIGRPLTALPEVNQLENPSNRLNHWQELQKIQQTFWKFWHQDYLRQLQTRPVKFREVNKISIGDMVLLKEDNLPPMKWSLGRIVKLFPGKDKVVRNVAVKTQQGEKQRNVRVLCPLPFQTIPENQSTEARECVLEDEQIN